MISRWVKLGLFVPFAVYASDEISSSSDVISSSSLTTSEQITEQLTSAMTSGIEYGILFSTLFAIASISLGLVASMINRSVGG